MNLIDILVEELPKRGGWPDGVWTIGQCYDGQVWYDDYGGAKEFPIVALNARKAGSAFTGGENEITRAKYEAALEAKNDGWIEWDGGERPVEKDMLVDVKFNNGEMNKNSLAGSFSWLHEWKSCNIIAYRPHKPAEVKTEWNGVGIPPIGSMVEIIDHDGMLVYGHGESGEVIANVEKTAVVRMSYGLGCFDAGFLKPLRTEADRKRDEAIEAITKSAGVFAVKSISEKLYDEIASGKIPGVKLED